MSTFQEPFAGTPYAATRRELGVDNSIPSGKASRGIIFVEDCLFRIRDTDGTPLCPFRYATIGRCWNYVLFSRRTCNTTGCTQVGGTQVLTLKMAP